MEEKCWKLPLVSPLAKWIFYPAGIRRCFFSHAQRRQVHCSLSAKIPVQSITFFSSSLFFPYSSTCFHIFFLFDLFSVLLVSFPFAPHTNISSWWFLFLVYALRLNGFLCEASVLNTYTSAFFPLKVAFFLYLREKGFFFDVSRNFLDIFWAESA